MANPALVAILIGFGIAGVIYFMFSDGESEQQSNTRHRSGSSNNNSFTNENSWTSSDQNSSYRRRSSRTPRNGNYDTCSICLEDIPSKTVTLPCKHKFHEHCITQWQISGTQMARNLCPNCRRPLPNGT